MTNSRKFLLAAASLTMFVACSPTQQETTEPARETDYTQERDKEVESERQEFITDSRERLGKLSEKERDLRTQIAEEEEFVDSAEVAKWEQDLYENQQKQARVTADLDRAQTVSTEEWEAMRGPTLIALDEMEASIAAMAVSTMSVFAGEAPQTGLCALNVQGAKMTVRTEEGAVIVMATTKQKNTAEDLNERGKNLARTKNYVPATAGDGVSMEQIRVRIRSEHVNRGVRVWMKPKNDEDLARLNAQVSRDAKQIAKTNCTTMPISS